MGMDLSSLQFSLLLQTGTTLRWDPTSTSYQVAQSLVQLSFECLQGWRTLSHPGPFCRANNRLLDMDDRGGGEQEWGGKWRKTKISVLICHCAAHLTQPTCTLCCRKAVVHIPSLWKSLSRSSQSITVPAGSSPGCRGTAIREYSFNY